MEGCCRPINVDRTSKGKCYKIVLIIFAIIYVAFLVLQIIYQDYSSISSSIFGIIFLVMLCILHLPFFASFLIFITFFNVIFTFDFLGQRLQNHLQKIEDDIYLHERIQLTWIQLANFIFLICLIIFSFLAYREFSAIEKEEELGINYQPQNDDEVPLNPDNYNNSANLQNPNSGFVPFRGQGYAVGGN